MTPFTANFSTLHSARVSDGVLEYSTYTYVQCSSYQVRPHYDSNLFIIKMCVKYLDFLREYGVHFSINRMLTFDSVKNRLDRETQVTFLEFNYIANIINSLVEIFFFIFLLG